MTAVEAFAPAKVNLTLHVTGRRADGYHLLDSLVAFADIGDHVRVRPAPEPLLTITGPMASHVPPGPDNLVMRAADLMGVSAAIEIEKNLPVAAGIGGGSSDAAATLRALSQMTNRPCPVDAARLGADLPVCLFARAARMRGIGGNVSPVTAMPALFSVLVNPGRPVATGAVFGRLRQHDNAPMPEVLPIWPDQAALIGWLALQRNDLQPAAIAEEPIIAEVLARLEATDGCGLARMSGSGATSFGLYPTAEAADRAAARIGREQRDWWVVSARLS